MPDVLVVDDSEFIRELVRAICSARGWSFAGADSLESGRAALAEAQPSVLVLDFHLPDGRGVDLAAHVHDRRMTSIVALTMQPRQYAHQRFQAEGIDTVLDKELVLRDELERHLAACLEAGRPAS